MMSITVVKKLFVPLVLAAFLIVGLFGLFHFAMNMNNSGDALGCPFMNITALCTMNPLVHITTWQSMFAASFSKEIFSFFALAFLIVLLAFGTRNLWCNRGMPHLFLRACRLIFQIFVTINPLQEAFSSGILNPKLYPPQANY